MDINEMQSHYILADSSFFILFLNDINDHSSLNKVIDKYKFIITRLIKDEITQSYNNNKVWLDEKAVLLLPSMNGCSFAIRYRRYAAFLT